MPYISLSYAFQWAETEKDLSVKVVEVEGAEHRCVLLSHSLKALYS